MDLLKQYQEKTKPQMHTAFRWQPPQEYSGMVRLVIQLSGGRIQDARQAYTVLLGVLIVCVALTTFFFVRGRQVSVEDYLPKYSETSVTP